MSSKIAPSGAAPRGGRALGGLHAETAVVLFEDGTSEPLPATMFASTAAINTIFL
jgi:hypothetical protein